MTTTGVAVADNRPASDGLVAVIAEAFKVTVPLEEEEESSEQEITNRVSNPKSVAFFIFESFNWYLIFVY